MSKKGFFNNYRHLNEDAFLIPLTMVQLADSIADRNYGTHRMVCALVEAHRRKYPESELADALEKAVEEFVT